MIDLRPHVRNYLIEQIARASTATHAMEIVVSTLKLEFSEYNWVGVYLLEGDELVLGPFLGAPTPHVRIPLNRGICGAAVSEQQTIVVDDVNSDPRYLACSIETKSEIVVPIMKDGAVYGEIDIDSHTPAAFGDADRVLLEEIANRLAEKLSKQTTSTRRKT